MRPSTMRSDPTENVESFATPLLNISLLYFVASSCVLPSDFLQAFFYMLAFACLCLFFFILTSRPIHNAQQAICKTWIGGIGFYGVTYAYLYSPGHDRGVFPFLPSLITRVVQYLFIAPQL